MSTIFWNLCNNVAAICTTLVATKIYVFWIGNDSGRRRVTIFYFSKKLRYLFVHQKKKIGDPSDNIFWSFFIKIFVHPEKIFIFFRMGFTWHPVDIWYPQMDLVQFLIFYMDYLKFDLVMSTVVILLKRISFVKGSYTALMCGKQINKNTNSHNYFYTPWWAEKTS